MATAGAIVGLRVPGVEVDDIGTTAKTLPEFPQLWADMLAGQESERLEARATTTSPTSGSGPAGARGRAPRPVPNTPTHEAAMVVTVDRGRWGCVLGGDPDRRVTAMRARELGRTPIVVGDDVDVVGDLSGQPDTLARIVRRGERRTVLRRTADDTDPTERVVVANADQLLDRGRAGRPAAAHRVRRAGADRRVRRRAEPILCLTKTDLAPPEPFAAQFADLDLTVVTAGRDDPLRRGGADCCAGKMTVLLGHSGVGKSTLVNRLVPEADRATGEVTGRRQGQAHLDAVGGAAAATGGPAG